MKEHPCRCPMFGESACLRLRYASRSEVTGRFCHQGTGRIRRPGENRNGDETKELLPMLPTGNLNKVVGPHDPHEATSGMARYQGSQGIDGVNRTQLALGVADAHAPIRRGAAGRSEPPFERSHVRGVFQRVLWRNQPPHLVQRQPLQRLPRNVPVPLVRRIERSPQESDALHASP